MTKLPAPDTIAYIEERQRRAPIGQLDPDYALRVLGIRNQWHPSDVFAFVHKNRADAKWASRYNKQFFGWQILHEALRVDGVGWVNVIGITETQLDGPYLTDPAAPWEWGHPEPFHRTS